MEADELPTYLVAQWLKAPITGCRFARMIASEKHDYVSIRLLTVRHAMSDPELPGDLHNYLLQASRDQSGVLFVFPNLRVDEDIVDLLIALAKHEAFNLSSKSWRPPARVVTFWSYWNGKHPQGIHREQWGSRLLAPCQ